MERKRQLNPKTRLHIIFHIIGAVFLLSKVGTIWYVNNPNRWVEKGLLLGLDIMIVIVMYRLFDAQYKGNQKIIRHEKITSEMMCITNDILSYVDIEALLQMILERAIDLVPSAQKGSILILDGDAFAYKASVGYDLNLLKKVRFKLEELLQYTSQGVGEPSIVVNIEQFNKERLSSTKFAILNQKGVLQAKSILSSAIVINGETYGTINLDNMDRENAFDEEDKQIIKHLSAQIGIALKNAQLVAEMLEISRYDGLTHAYSRKYFEELFAKQYNAAKQSKQIFTTCVIDLNNLKDINDTFGHAAGDKLLAFFASTIQKNIRKVDLFARIGGDEFAIVFLNTDTEQVNCIMEKIQIALAQNPLEIGDRKHHVSFAFGTAQYPGEGEDTRELMKIADDRMYLHKGEMKCDL